MQDDNQLAIIGADTSGLMQIEDFGGKFYHEGQEKDCLIILKEHGFNFIRLRVWNNPGPPFNQKGYNNKEHTLIMARRVKQLGLKLLIDFHYSDFWADPNKQHKPGEWKNLKFKDLNSAVYHFTKDVITDLINQNTIPDMVQIGNEIDNGLLWEDGRLDGTQVQWDKFGSLVKSGIEGVKQSIKNNENISIMIHKADGCNNQAARNFFDNIHKINIEFDIIGFSYYPFFHGTFEELKMNLKDISKRYHKDIIIVETAWGWTGENGDGYPHLIKTNKPLKLPFSGKGQILFIKRLVDIIIKINHCKGLFYWAPEFIPVNGVGWKNGEGNEWDNMTLFDFQGNALDSLDAFLK